MISANGRVVIWPVGFAPGPKHAFFFFSFPYLSCSCSCLCGVCACTCLCICVVCIWTYMWKSEVNIGYLPLLILSFIFKTGSHWTWRLLIWLDYPVSWFCICPSTGVTPSFMWVGSRDLDVGPRAYAASSHWTSPAACTQVSCWAALPKEHVATMCSSQAGKRRKKPYPEGLWSWWCGAAPLAALCSFPGLWLDEGRDIHRENKGHQVTGGGIMGRLDRKRFDELTVHQNPVVEHLPQQSVGTCNSPFRRIRLCFFPLLVF